ncbi:MAG: copper-binding protein [Magnetococcales bacterium]|nr:copper-binding protein [Magnetococcales bacterium]
MKIAGILSSAVLMLTIGSGVAWSEGSHGHDGMNMNMDNHAPTQKQMGIKATGKLNSIMMNKHKVNITHGPIPALNWPPMRMDFAVRQGVALAGLKPGQKVSFSLMKSGEYEYVVTKITPIK